MGESDATTRRAWLLRLGEFTTLAGFAGVPGEALPAPAQASQLPPGLYEPSLDHLVHMRALQGRGPVPAGPYQPQFFSPPEFQTVTRLVELILGDPAPAPETIAEVAAWIDLTVSQSAAVRRAAQALSPAHRTLAVHYEGKAHVEEFETQDLAAICREGLKRLAGFNGLDRPRQLELLSSLAEDPFFALIKAETIRGYYTSREGLAELDYKGNSFYAESPGCSVPTDTKSNNGGT
ncbi:MAG TPA: gluconate 2-dehydrogenase subunit 3 family protein [Bryobacteraceae bacterium]|nr:gluconate 2-dehydrogenase subunit 3 family protein [Bryobacteraceae bacterium]